MNNDTIEGIVEICSKQRIKYVKPNLLWNKHIIVKVSDNTSLKAFDLESYKDDVSNGKTLIFKNEYNEIIIFIIARGDATLMHECVHAAWTLAEYINSNSNDDTFQELVAYLSTNLYGNLKGVSNGSGLCN